MKILITGANGFIGGAILNDFMSKGLDAYGWVRSASTEEKDNIKCVDMSSVEVIQDALVDMNPDVIIHCAGAADVRKSVSDPKSDFTGNVVLTHNLLFAIHALGLDEKIRVVFLSSAAVYGNPRELPIKEQMERKPLSPYALHKIMSEEICFYFIQNFHMDIKIARIFSAYGPGLRKQIFWDMFQKYKKSGKLELFGMGSESRDYIYIEDLVQAIYLIAVSENSADIIYNVANGEEVTIKEAAKVFAEYMGISERDVIFNGITRPGDPLNWRADVSRLKELGYHAGTSMDVGIQNYIEWLRRFE